jgi:antitoxin Phd
MKRWSITDAKANFSKLLDATVREGPQVVTRRGVDAAVVVSAAEWKGLTEGRPKSAIDILVDDPRRFELDLPPRGELGLRPPLDFD